MEIYILFLDFDLIEWILSSVISFMNHLHTIRIYCIFAQMQHDSLHDSFIFKASTLYQRHLCLYKETVQKIFFLTYFLLWGLSGRPIEDRALLPRLDKSLRSGPRNRSKKESGRSTSLRSLCDAQFLSITRNWASLGDRKMSNRNTSKLFMQYVAFCSSHVKYTLNMFKFCTVLFSWWVWIILLCMVKSDVLMTDAECAFDLALVVIAVHMVIYVKALVWMVLVLPCHSPSTCERASPGFLKLAGCRRNDPLHVRGVVLTKRMCPKKSSVLIMFQKDHLLKLSCRKYETPELLKKIYVLQSVALAAPCFPEESKHSEF